jgi:hypothetical protein
MARRGNISDQEYIRSRILVEDCGYLSPCWIWQQGLFRATGYSQGHAPGGHPRLGHRLAYEAFVGPIPVGLNLDHLCRVIKCVNPAHLEAVTQRENLLRGESPVAINARRTHCINGHEFTPENTGRHGGHRRCVICRRAESVRGAIKRKARRAAARQIAA